MKETDKKDYENYIIKFLKTLKNKEIPKYLDNGKIEDYTLDKRKKEGEKDERI